jgi:PA domain
MKKTHLIHKKLTSVGLMALTLGSLALKSQAASVLFDFNSDPTGVLNIYGNSTWVPNGGVGSSTNANDGYLQVTAALGSQRGAIVFADFDGGQVVKAFTFEADVRIGNGTVNPPADGFSINYVRANDPVLSAANPATDNVWATGPNCEDNLPEEGATTGIGIGFDAWNSGGTAPFCNEADQSVGPDIVGVSVRVDGLLVTQFPTPTLNGSCSDPTSLQTGPLNPSLPGDPSGLCWAHVKVVLDTNAVLNVYWKNTLILSNYQTTYFPSAGRLAFVGRTGGNNENHHVDNIQITTIPASIGLVGSASGFADGFSVTLSDSGSSVINPATVTTVMNGSPVTGAVTKNGATTTVIYHGYPALLPPGSSNVVVVHALDGNSNPINGTRSFTAPNYLTLDTSLAVTGVNTTAPGFRILPWQSAGEPNRTYWSLEQIAGLHGANNADLTQATDGGYIDYTTNEINFNITPSSAPGGGEAGNFRTNNGYADALFPGIPGANGLNGSTAENIVGFIRFASAGVYTMGVNSDDGFLVSMGRNPSDRFARTLGFFDGGRGSADTTWIMAVTNAGIYPIRLLWENGNGEAGNGANLEWFMVNSNGTKVLINDPSVTNTTGVTVFYSGPGLPAYVSHINPLNGTTTARADTLWAQLTDGGGTTVNGGSISLKVNGTALTTTISKVGNVTTIKGADTTHLLPAGTNNVSLVWTDSAATTTTNTWSFIVKPYVTLSAAMSAPLSAADLSVPGFVMKVSQVDPCMPHAFFGGPDDCGDGTVNQVDSANQMIAGLYYPWYGTNSAFVDTVPNPDVVDTNTYTFYWQNPVNFNENNGAGDFGGDFLVPGLPSFDGIPNNRPNDSYSMTFDTYVMFPSAGYYIMGVSSDDAFRVTQGWGLPRPILHVKGASVERDVLAIPSTPSSVRDNVWLGALPQAPITAPIVYVDNSECPGPTTLNLTGKIALIDADRCGGGDGGYNAKVAMCQARGALAVIVQATPGFGTPDVMGGGTNVITIPALHINGFNGEKDWFHTNGPLVATIAGDNHIKLGEADFGKGMDHQEFSFIVPAPGVYPLHLAYEQGGGGAGIEWQSIAGPDIAVDTTNRFLVNDNSASSPLLVYRAVTTPPKFLSQTVVNGTLTLVWFGGGTLQQTSSLVAPITWTDVNPQPLGDTYTVIATGSQKFYRLRR